MVGLVVGNKQLMDEARTHLHDAPVRVVLEQREIGNWADFLEKLDRVRPDVLLIEFSQIADPMEDVIRQIKATAGGPKVIVIHHAAEPELLLRAIRANADEYLYPPLKDDLAAAMRRISDERAKNKAGTKPRGKVFGVFSAKGGCGTTAICCHLAVQLSRQSPMEVLLADFDMDSGIIGFLMQSQCRYSVLDALDNINRLDLSFWKALVSNGIPGLEVIMAPQSHAMRRDRRLDDLRHILRFVRSNYDWTLVDLGRGLTNTTMTVLEELDEAFLITTLDIPALHQAKQIISTLRDLGYAQHRLRLLLNQMPRRSDITVKELERMLEQPVYSVLPHDYESISDAYSEKKLASPESPFGKAIVQLGNQISGAQPKKSKGSFFSLLG